MSLFCNKTPKGTGGTAKAYVSHREGTLEDGEGREIGVKNPTLLLTSNVGTEKLLKVCEDPNTTPSPEALAAAIRPDLLGAKTENSVSIFKQAFLGHLMVVSYFPISDTVLRQIIRLQLRRIGQRLRQNHNAKFSYAEPLI
jgi:type VI secretion system protein VasG